MPRPTQRTEIFDPELAERLMRLFGTLPNVSRRLRLAGHVTYNDLRRAFTGQAVTAEVADLINDHARAWLRQWVKGVGDRHESRRDLTFDLEEE